MQKKKKNNKKKSFIDETNGSSGDWAKGVANAKYQYAVETRGDWFIADQSDIEKSTNEIWEGLVTMTKTIQLIENEVKK